MKKLFILTTFSIFLLTSSSAFALNFIDTYFDLNTVDGTYFNVDDGITEPFFEFTYFAETLSQISAAGVITDSGVARSTGLNTVSGDIPGDTEGYGSQWGLAFVWNDLTGQVISNSGGVIEAVYTSGTFDFYLDYDPYAVNLGTPATLIDGQKIATVEITGGGYRLDTSGGTGSSYTLLGEFTSILDNFWYNAANGEDLSDDLLTNEWVLAYTAGDNDPASVDITFNNDGSLTVVSSHDSSMSVAVVPEPSTFLLLGFGLAGLGFVTRRKNR